MIIKKEIFKIFLFMYSAFLYTHADSILIDKNYAKYITQEIKALDPYAEIILDQYVFTLNPLQETLAQKALNGARVSINMHRAHPSNSSTYYFFEDMQKTLPNNKKNNLKINKYPGKYTLHAKHLSWQEDEHCACHIGSHNLTNLGALANKELMVATYDDKHYYKKCKAFHDTVSKLCNQTYEQNKVFIERLKPKVVQAFPQKRTLFSSFQHDINKTLIHFIDLLPAKSFLVLGAFSINDTDFVDALCKASDRGVMVTFYIDGQTVNKKTEQYIIDHLYNHDIPVLLYNKDGSLKYGKYKKKMHAKFFAAHLPDDITYVIISTRNFTKLFGLNMASIHPYDKKLYNELIIWCEILTEECTYYECNP